MQSTLASAFVAERRTVAIDLIGDLDATLGTVLGETLLRMTDIGADAIAISTRHIARSTRDGLANFDAAVERARADGCSISIDAGNRRMRTAFALARIACDRVDLRTRSRRHVMIAHHTVAERAVTY